MKWEDKNTVSIKSLGALKEGEGVTLSALYPKNYFTLYKDPWYIEYQWLLIIFLPLLFFYISYNLWKKYGKDPKISPTIAPEFEIPEDLAPIEMGIVYSDGILSNQYLSAGIISLAVKGIITIKQNENGKIFKTKDYEFTRTDKSDTALPLSEKKLLEKLFGNKNTVNTTDLKNKFYEKIPDITNSVTKELAKEDLIVESSRSWQYGFIVFTIILIVAGVASMSFSYGLGTGLLISALIFLIFTPLMTRRTEKGAKLFKRIQGLKLYMTKAEKYRQQFNEKENIFEKFLPYAIMFGITQLWMKKMEILYSKEFAQNYHPIWYYGLGSSNFDFNSFSSDMTSLSSTIGSTLSSSPSSSGAGGGGFSGGGGGGGGGGGW